MLLTCAITSNGRIASIIYGYYKPGASYDRGWSLGRLSNRMT